MCSNCICRLMIPNTLFILRALLLTSWEMMAECRCIRTNAIIYYIVKCIEHLNRVRCDLVNCLVNVNSCQLNSELLTSCNHVRLWSNVTSWCNPVARNKNVFIWTKQERISLHHSQDKRTIHDIFIWTLCEHLQTKSDTLV